MQEHGQPIDPNLLRLADAYDIIASKLDAGAVDYLATAHGGGAGEEAELAAARLEEADVGADTGTAAAAAPIAKSGGAVARAVAAKNEARLLRRCATAAALKATKRPESRQAEAGTEQKAAGHGEEDGDTDSESDMQPYNREGGKN
jgi:hypothetical protein